MSNYSEHQNKKPQSDPSQPKKPIFQLGSMISQNLLDSSQSLNSNSVLIQRPHVLSSGSESLSLVG